MLKLSDDQWIMIREHFPEENIPPDRAGRKPISTRRVLEAVLWILNMGAQWHMLPQCYPNYKTMSMWRFFLKTEKSIDKALADHDQIMEIDSFFQRNKRRFDKMVFALRTNSLVFLKILTKWPIPTLGVITVFAFPGGYYFIVEYGMGPGDMAFSVVACILILLFFKNIFLLSFFRGFFGEKFGGSLPAISLFNSLLFVIAILLVSAVVNNNVEDFPMAELKWFLPLLLFQAFLLNLIVTVSVHKMME